MKCDNCDDTFATSDLVEDHKKSQHLNIRCDHCNFNTESKEALVSHVSSKHEEVSEVITCDKCNFNTISAESLRQHIVKDHGVNILHGFTCDKWEYKSSN